MFRVEDHDPQRSECKQAMEIRDLLWWQVVHYITDHKASGLPKSKRVIMEVDGFRELHVGSDHVDPLAPLILDLEQAAPLHRGRVDEPTDRSQDVAKLIGASSRSSSSPKRMFSGSLWSTRSIVVRVKRMPALPL